MSPSGNRFASEFKESHLETGVRVRLATAEEFAGSTNR